MSSIHSNNNDVDDDIVIDDDGKNIKTIVAMIITSVHKVQERWKHLGKVLD